MKTVSLLFLERNLFDRFLVFSCRQKRAIWKYLTERAAIAARWTWLQSQISDLEYRIRQHSDLHKKVRSQKCPVELEGPSPPQSVPSSPNAVNGYRGQLPGASPVSGKSSEVPVNGECFRFTWINSTVYGCGYRFALTS